MSSARFECAAENVFFDVGSLWRMVVARRRFGNFRMLYRGWRTFADHLGSTSNGGARLGRRRNRPHKERGVSVECRKKGVSACRAKPTKCLPAPCQASPELFQKGL